MTMIAVAIAINCISRALTIDMSPIDRRLARHVRREVGARGGLLDDLADPFVGL